MRKLKGKYQYIYITTNNINNKIYIGRHSAKSLENSYLGSGVIFSKAVKKFGKINFTKNILELCLNCDYHIAKREMYYIKLYNSNNLNIGYNLSEGGEMNSGYIVSDLTKKLISKNHKDVSGANNPRFGISLSQETKDKISKAQKGKRCGVNSVHFGKTNSPESIEKMRKTKLGKKLTEEHKRKISEGGKGRVASRESVEITRLKNTGQKRSLETKLKLSQANKNRKFIICPHCGKSSQGYTMMHRWHFNNCKYKIN